MQIEFSGACESFPSTVEVEGTPRNTEQRTIVLKRSVKIAENAVRAVC